MFLVKPYIHSSILSLTSIVITIYASLIVTMFLSINNVHAINVIIANDNVTIGTDEADLINGCSYLKPECSQGSIIDGMEDKDILQGSSSDDSLLGGEGDDELTGSDGNDRLFGEKGNDVLQAGFGADLLIAGSGNDESYAGPGDDVPIGGAGADYFDCGIGYDVVVDFNPTKGDTTADNCEVMLTHSAYSIDLLCTGNENAGKYYQYQQSSASIDSTEGYNEYQYFI
jgi:Ca2+-binding RTX toxin-like protein